jgi:uncharacterized membrane protein YoaK (UPF0700 family)
MTGISILILVFVVGAAIIAILSQIKPAPILWVSVILLCVVEAIHTFASTFPH